MDFVRLLREERRLAKTESSPLVSEKEQKHQLQPAQQAFDVQLRIELKELIPQSLYYCDDVISEATAVAIEDALDKNGSDFKQLSARRVAVYGQLPAGMDSACVPIKPLPKWLENVANALCSAGVFEDPPNNVLVNSYLPTGGIFHHTDGPAYASKVAVLSIGGPVKLGFRKRLRSSEIGSITQLQDAAAVILAPNSLLVFQGDMYNQFTHGIEEGVEKEIIDHLVINCFKTQPAEGMHIDRNSRLSLTFRHVLC